MTNFFKKHKKTLLGCVASLSALAILIIANCLANFIVPTNNLSSQVQANEFEMYLISLSKSQVESEARSHAEDFQIIGAGGFIWEKDGYFHIISSGYLNKPDAELVQNSIKLNQNLDSELLSVKFDSISIYGNWQTEESKALSALLSSCTNFYCNIYDIAISLDTAVCNETTAKLAVNSAHHDFSTTLANFNTLFSKPCPENLSSIYNLAVQGYKIGEKLAREEKVNPNQNYSSLLKYRYLEVMNLYYNFCLEDK
ncbi:MAG: hypothetical protein E7379_02280 [Clostridiales bacterium]|nr:hypothetical protein [Clostridiales bacterium]